MEVREQIKQRLKRDGLNITKLHGYFIGNEYNKVSVAFFPMQCDTSVVIYKKSFIDDVFFLQKVCNLN